MFKSEPSSSTAADLKVQSRPSDIREEADPVLCLQRVELLLEGLGFQMQRLGNLPPILSRRLGGSFESITAMIVDGIRWDAHISLEVRSDTNVSRVAKLDKRTFSSIPYTNETLEV